MKDTDYLSLSARIHAMETRLLTRERMERMIDAKDHGEAVKVLSECGYGELAEVSAPALESVLSAAREELFRDLQSALPHKALLDVFRIKYDYHNAKVLVKSAADTIPAHLLMGGGRYDRETLLNDFRRNDLRSCSPVFAQGVTRAAEALAATGDPQLCDFILDRACYEELSAVAGESGSQFLQGYVALLIDTINLRAVVRSLRLNKGSEFLSEILLPGGRVDIRALSRARGEDVSRLFASGPLATAAALGSALCAPGSGSLTAFERACDNAATAYVSAARRIPFGEQPVVGYLHARESELTAIRTILSGRLAGLDGDVIRERLRDQYV